ISADVFDRPGLRFGKGAAQASCRELVVAVDADEFLDKVVGEFDVDAPEWRGHGVAIVRRFHHEAEVAKDAFDVVLRDLDPENLGDPRASEVNGRRLALSGIHVDHPGGDAPTSMLL